MKNDAWKLRLATKERLDKRDKSFHNGSHLIIQTVAVVLCFETQRTVLVVDRSALTVDSIKEVSRVELETFLSRLDADRSATLWINDPGDRECVERESSDSHGDLLAEITFSIPVDNEHHIVSIERFVDTSTDSS